MKRFFFDCGTRDALASTGILFLRVSFGLMMMIGHGIGKWQAFSQLSGNWPVPRIWPLSMMSGPVSLIATIGAEVFAAALLVLGLATRPAAFVFGFAMCVAAFQVNVNADFFSTGGPAKEMAVLYLIPCFVLIITGGGQWSADALFNTEDRRRRRR
ncbi:DoxX family protein [Haloferula sp. BvORR071]|uniref:DoxX family protein n=1 Tax=Haloferula sp. BvORR071 TaxID=1396141 RepID=UPI000552C140|nr:DoxX family protein [Haloferula sp. BvORR071]